MTTPKAPYNHNICKFRLGCSKYCVHRRNKEKYSIYGRNFGKKPKSRNLSYCDQKWCPFKITTKIRKI
jgi:hypothetical protein